MARLFAKGFGLASVYAEEEARRTACASCGIPFSTLYDEVNERYFCEYNCVEAYVAENPKEFAVSYEETMVNAFDD